MQESYLLLGLGNPGKSYERTRHNVGFLSVNIAADAVGARLRRPLFSSYQVGSAAAGKNSCVLVKPLTYMNRSGIVLPRLMRKHRISCRSLIVLCDNMDLPPGAVRVRRGGGTAGHRGLQSITQELHDSGFIRIYIGIGRPKAGCTVVDHVLGIPDEAEFSLIEQGVIRAGEAAIQAVTQPLERVMNEYNRKDAHITNT